MSAHPTAKLGGYILGVLPASAEPDLRRHLEDCPDCRTRLNQLDGISELLAAARLVPEETPRLAPHILATLPQPGQAYALGRTVPSATTRPEAPGQSPSQRIERQNSVEPRRPLGRDTFVALGAVALAAVVAVLVLTMRGGGGSSPAITLEPSGTDAVGTVRFEDTGAGTGVTLDVRRLPPGPYSVTVDNGTETFPAGGFSVGKEGVAVVRLNTAATEGELQIWDAEDESRAALLRAPLPD